MEETTEDTAKPDDRITTKLDKRITRLEHIFEGLAIVAVVLTISGFFGAYQLSSARGDIEKLSNDVKQARSEVEGLSKEVTQIVGEARGQLNNAADSAKKAIEEPIQKVDGRVDDLKSRVSLLEQRLPMLIDEIMYTSELATGKVLTAADVSLLNLREQMAQMQVQLQAIDSSSAVQNDSSTRQNVGPPARPFSLPFQNRPRSQLMTWLSSLEPGKNAVVIGSYDSAEKALEVARKLRRRFPELFFPFVTTTLHSKYRNENIFWDGKYFAVYVGGLYDQSSAERLKKYALDKGLPKDSFVAKVLR